MEQKTPLSLPLTAPWAPIPFYPKVLTRRWGRIGGKRSRSIRMWVVNGEELQHQVARLSRRRQAHGYRLVQELRGAALREKAA